MSACGRLGFDEPVPPPAECTLALDVGAPVLNFNSQRAVQIAGGTAPVSLTISSLATIDGSGVVTSREEPGTATIDAIDAGGCTAQATLQIGGNTLFYVGGTLNAVPTNDVLASSDGIAWTKQATGLPAKRTSGGLLVFRDRMWWLTGSDGAATKDEVYVTSDGLTWTLVGHVPVAVNLAAFAVFQDRMWIIGGDASPDTDAVYSSADGATWTLEGHLLAENHGGSAAVVGDRLWYLGGHSRPKGKLYAWVLRTEDGVTWKQIGDLPTGREYAATYVDSGEIVFAGGQDLTPTATTAVLSTKDGVTFTSRAPLPVARAFGAIAPFAGAAWSVGGTDGGAVVRGSMAGPWTAMTTTGFATPRQGGRLAVFSAP